MIDCVGNLAGPLPGEDMVLHDDLYEVPGQVLAPVLLLLNCNQLNSM